MISSKYSSKSYFHLTLFNGWRGGGRVGGCDGGGGLEGAMGRRGMWEGVMGRRESGGCDPTVQCTSRFQWCEVRAWSDFSSSSTPVIS